MKRQIEIVMFLPPVLLLLLVGTAQLVPAFTTHNGSQLLFRVFDALWICAALGCIIRGFWILKARKRLGWICIAVGFFYLLFLAMIQPATT
jgi:hypothetical protein